MATDVVARPVLHGLWRSWRGAQRRHRPHRERREQQGPCPLRSAARSTTATAFDIAFRTTLARVVFVHCSLFFEHSTIACLRLWNAKELKIARKTFERIIPKPAQLRVGPLLKGLAT